jgi:hypothetical protein
LRLERLEDRTLPSFAAPIAFNLPAAPQAVATGHFEGNNAPLDVVSANANGVVSVFLGQSCGILQNPVNVHVGGNPTSVAVGDFLGNGVQDIVTANSNGTVNVVLSNGNGSFATPTSIALGATPVGVAVGDFNGDGKLDVVTANSNGTVSVLAGNGKGGFAAPVTTKLSGAFTSVAVGDFNGDGKPDLVVGTTTGLDVLVGNGNSTFGLKQTVSFARIINGFVLNGGVDSVAVGNFQGHGNEDIVADSGGSLSVLLGNGDGTVQKPVGLNDGPNAARSFVVGDFTGDGKQDIVTSDFIPYGGGAPSISLLAGKGNGTFAAPTIEVASEVANALAAGDLNGDGKLDLVFASDSGGNTVTALLNKGGGTFATTASVAVTVAPTALAAADFTGNGKQDLVVMGEVGDISILLSNGDGTFRAGPTLTDSGPLAVTVGDFTGNGKQDVAVGNFDGTVDVFLGNGNGTFQAPKVFNLGSNDVVSSIVAGDFNHDGKQDLAVAFNNSVTGVAQVATLLSNGNGTFHESAVVSVGTDSEGLAAGDLNGDGNLDLATTTFLPSGNRDVKILFGNGNGTFRAPVALTPGTRSTRVAVGDFNGDGKADLVLVDPFNNNVSVLLNNGNGTFASPQTTHVDNPVVGLNGPALGDFFGDGKLGLAVLSGQGTVSVLRGNGDGTFQAPIDYLTGFHGTFAEGVVAADFTGNGKLDLATASLTTDTVSVLLNTSPKPVLGTVATTTSLRTDVNPAVAGQQVLLTATVTSSAGTPTGTVNFFDGTTLLGQAAVDPNGQATLLVTLHAGTHSLKAVFAGTTPFTGSSSAVVSETVHKDATTTTFGVSHLGGSVFELAINLTPDAPGGGVPTGTLTIRDGTTVLATIPASQAQAFVRLGRGRHTLTVTYSGDADFLTSVSAPVVFTT